MTHTSDLDHALAEALREASEIDFTVHTCDETGRPLSFAVVAWRDGEFFYAAAETAVDALDAAMIGLRAAMGGAA